MDALIPCTTKMCSTKNMCCFLFFWFAWVAEAKNQILHQSQHFYTVIRKSLIFPNAFLKEHELKEFYFPSTVKGKNVCPVKDIHINELHVPVCTVFHGYNSTNACMCEKQHDSHIHP